MRVRLDAGQPTQITTDQVKVDRVKIVSSESAVQPPKITTAEPGGVDLKATVAPEQISPAAPGRLERLRREILDIRRRTAAESTAGSGAKEDER